MRGDPSTRSSRPVTPGAAALLVLPAGGGGNDGVRVDLAARRFPIAEKRPRRQPKTGGPTRRCGWIAVGVASVLLGTGCGQKGGGELHARRAVLQREVEGLRETAARMERGEPVLAPHDLAIGVSDQTVQDMLAPQLPFEAEASGFAVSMSEAELRFRGAPGITLRGRIHPVEHPDLVGEVRAIGTLDDIAVDPGSATLRARVVIDHLDLVQMAGLESFVPAGATDELARTLRHAFEGQIPAIQIPVRIEPAVEFPSVTEGPVRLQGASMPLAVAVSRVFAGQGTLWIGVSVEPGELVRQGSAPPEPGLAEAVGDVDLEEGPDGAAGGPKKASGGPGGGR
jgi:hypothetical protein